MSHRKMIAVFCILSVIFNQCLTAAGDTFIDYQNYNHGYCPECNYYPCQCDTGYCPNPNPCPTCPNEEAPPPYPLEPAPCPPTTQSCRPCAAPCEENSVCGISVYIVAIVMVLLATAAAIIVGSNNGQIPTTTAL